jgi:photosystem II stability/assembly factor-like uncharacterized protein
MQTLRILPAALLAFLSLLATTSSAWAQSITNGAFETPTVSTYQSSPAGSGWTWSGAGLSGISSGTWSGSGFGVTGTRTGQFAYLLWYAGVGGSVSQSVTFPTPGRYRLTESIAGRDIASGGPGNAAFAITISGGIFSRGGNTSTGMPFQTYEDTIDVPTAGTYTLTYSNVTGSGEDTFFVDDVSISYIGPGASNPAGTDKTLTVAAGGIHTFATGDWGFTDPYSSPADNFAAVTLTTLPTIGTLMVDYIPVTTTPRSVDLLNAIPAGATWTARESSREWYSITSSADGSKLAAVANNGQIYTSTDLGSSWTARESNRYWRSITSSADGSKLAAVVSRGQIYTSTDGGVSWTARESNRGWASITSSADGSKLAAVELFGQIHTSTDGGVSWTARESNRMWQSITSSADGSKLAAVAWDSQIHISTDGGVSWTPRESNRVWQSITSSADGSRLAAVEYDGRIHISTDGGVSWTARESYRNWYSITSSADGRKLAAATEGQIYTSTDGGVNWVAREDERFWISITSSADGNRLAAVAVRDQIYTSAGSGVISYSGPATAGSTSFTFQVQDDAASNNLDLSPNTITFNIVPTVVSSTAHLGSTATSLTITGTGFSTTPGNNTVVFAPSGTGTVTAATPTSLTVGGLSGLSLGALSAVVTTNGQTSGAAVQVATVVPSHPAGTDKTLTVAAGGTHTFASSDWGFTDPYSSPADNFSAVTLTTLPASGTLRVDSSPVTTTPRSVSVIASLAGATWIARESVRSWLSITSSADGSKLAAVVYNGQIHTSTDGGMSWTARESNRIWRSITSSADGSNLAAVEDGGQIYTSTDGGVSWTARESNRLWQSITSSADGSKLAAVVYSGHIHTSTDGGISWTARDSFRGWRSITSSVDGSKLAAVADGGQIYTSTDGGVSWTARESNRLWQSITSSADGSKLAAVEFGGQIYTSTDGGASWTARESNRGWYSITSSADGSKLAAVAYSGQIHTSTDGGESWTAREFFRYWSSITSSADGSKLAAVSIDGQIHTSVGGVPVISYSAPATAGSASFTFQVQDDAISDNIDPTPNTITFNIVPTVVTSTMALAPDANTLTITGTGFSTTPGDNTVVFSPAGSGTVTAATPTSLTVVGLSGLSLGALSAVVTTNGQASGPPVQVATVMLPQQNPAGTDKPLTVAAGGTHTFASSDWGFTDPNSSPADNFAAVILATLPGSGTVMVDSGPVTTTPRSVNMLAAPTGATWTAQESIREWTSITSSADGSKLAAVAYGQIYISTDGGVTWTARESSRGWVSITSSADGSKLAAVEDGGQIYISTDGGANWVARESNRVWWSITSSADGSRLAAVVNGGHIHTSVSIDVPVISYSAPATAGSASFTFQVQDDAANDNIDPTPNTITFNIVPTVVTSTAGLSSSATTLTINGTGFSTTPGDNTVVFSPAGTGTVTAATPTSLTMGSLSGLSLGALSAVVTTNGQTSGAAVPVATVSLSLQSWRQIHFGSASNTGIAADTYDADNDGLANLLEYAFALDPMAGGGRAQLPQGELDDGGNTFTIQFTQPEGVTGVTYGAKFSPGLEAGNWQAIPDTGSGMNHVFSVPVSGETRLFIRLEVTAAP